MRSHPLKFSVKKSFQRLLSYETSTVDRCFRGFCSFTISLKLVAADDALLPPGGTIVYVERHGGGRSGSFHFHLLDVSTNTHTPIPMFRSSMRPVLSPNREMVAGISRSSVHAHSAYVFRLADFSEVESFIPDELAQSDDDISRYIRMYLPNLLLQDGLEETRRLFRLLYSPNGPTWSADSRWVAFSQVGQYPLILFDLEAGQLNVPDAFPNDVPVDSVGRLIGGGVNFSPDNRFVAFAMGYNRLSAFELGYDDSLDNLSNRTILVYSVHDLSLVARFDNITDFLDWHPNNSKIVLTRWTGDQQELTIAELNGAESIIAANASDTFSRAAWSPDGTLLAYIQKVGDNQWQINYHSVEENVSTLPTPRFPNRSALIWSPEGDYLAFRGGIIDIENESLLNTDLLSEANAYTWHPDGNWLTVSHVDLGAQKAYLSVLNVRTQDWHRLLERNIDNGGPFGPFFENYVVLDWILQ